MYNGGEIDPELKEEAQILLEDCRNNLALFCKMIFPERFDFPFSKGHMEICRALDDDSIKKLLIVAPRGFGKTTLLQLGFAAQRILFNKSRFIVPISKSEINALNQTETLKMQLVSNLMIKKLWGSMKTQQFSKEQWRANNMLRTVVMPRGSGQQVRGLLLDNRPDLLIGDDVEDIEGVESETQREKLKRRIMEDYLNCVDFKKNDWRIVFIGSMLHEDSFLANIEDNYRAAIKAGRKPAWHVINLPLCDDNYKSNWPEAYTDEWIQDKLAEYASMGLLDSFAREFMGVPTSAEANFRREYFRQYKESELPEDVRRRLVNVVISDPAKTAKKTSCDTAIVVWGIDLVGQSYYLRSIVREHLHLDEIITRVLDAAARWRARAIGVEVTGSEEQIMYPLKNEMLIRRQVYHVEELRARGKKEERAATMLPYYKMHRIFHEESIASLIELPLLSFPRCKKWDVIDAASYLPKMLNAGGLYLRSDDYGDAKSLNDYYRKLKEEDERTTRLHRWEVCPNPFGK